MGKRTDMSEVILHKEQTSKSSIWIAVKKGPSNTIST